MKTVIRSKNTALVEAILATLKAERPMTLRQLYYRMVSAGKISNVKAEYDRLKVLAGRLREHGDVPRSWMVDHTRATLKPSSWTGLEDFGDTVRRAYRKDFWASLEHCVEVFCEKDAIAGTIQPITHKYDVALRVCRGYASISFAGEIAEDWREIGKPIVAYYLGDFDPSGHDIERDLWERLERYSGCRRVEDGQAPQLGEFAWVRLAVLPEDFERHDLIALPVKDQDTRSRAWRQRHGDRCAEVDAIAPTELRARVDSAIKQHIDPVRWSRLIEIEEAERAALAKINLGSLSRSPRNGADA